MRKSVKVAPKTSSFNAYKGFFTFLRTVPVHRVEREDDEVISLEKWKISE